MRISDSDIWSKFKQDVNDNALSKDGGIMRGDIDMNENIISGLVDPANNGDAVNFKFLKQYQHPWEYDLSMPTENICIDGSTAICEVCIEGELNQATVAKTMSDKKFYFINSGSIFVFPVVRCTQKGVSGSTTVTNWNVRFYLNDIEVACATISSKISDNGTSFEEQGQILSVKKGDCLTLSVEGGKEKDRTIYTSYGIKINTGSSYKYNNANSGYITT